jgi:hypothetical protein
MAQEPDPPPDTARAAAEVDPEHGGLARHDGHEAGQCPEERGLAGAVRAAHEHDLAGVNLEVDASQCGDAIEEADRGTKADDVVHGVRATLPAPPEDDQGSARCHDPAGTRPYPRPG